MPETQNAPPPSPDDPVFARRRALGMIGGYSGTQVLYAAVALGIADILADGPQRIEVIAKACGCDASRLEALLEALCAVGVFRRSEAGYALTALSNWLLTSTPGTLAPMILIQGNEMYRAFGHLLANIRTGKPGWELEFGESMWQYFDSHPERGAYFDQFMALGLEDVDGVAAAIEAEGAPHVVDVGGGNGSLLRRLLARESAWTGTLFDRADVIQRASEDAGLRSLGERCRFVSGDFFRELPAGGDLYVLRHVLHDWGDEECVRILSTCHRAMGKSARLVVVEALLGANAGQVYPAWSNLGMMLIGGRERPLAAFEELFRRAGFTSAGVKAAGPHVFAMEAKAAA